MQFKRQLYRGVNRCFFCTASSSVVMRGFCVQCLSIGSYAHWNCNLIVAKTGQEVSYGRKQNEGIKQKRSERLQIHHALLLILSHRWCIGTFAWFQCRQTEFSSQTARMWEWIFVCLYMCPATDWWAVQGVVHLLAGIGSRSSIAGLAYRKWIILIFHMETDSSGQRNNVRYITFRLLLALSLWRRLPQDVEDCLMITLKLLYIQCFSLFQSEPGCGGIDLQYKN